MPEKKTKQIHEKKLVEVPSELLEPVSLTDSPAILNAPGNLPNSAKSSPPESDSTPVSSIESPHAVLESKLWLMARFAVITILIGFIPYMLAPGFLLPSFNHPLVRTCALAALIWNLIGAALFANSKTRGSKILLILVFALPLMTIALWWFSALSLLHTLGVPVS